MADIEDGQVLAQAGRGPCDDLYRQGIGTDHTYQRFEDTETLVRDFGYIADLLGPRMGCFLFQLPPSYHYSADRLGILRQLDPARRNVIEFRHAKLVD